MQNYVILFVIAAFLINAVHGYLLWSQRGERKYSISEHAIKNRQTYLLYILGHLVTGILVVFFAYLFFVRKLAYNPPFYLCISFMFFEVVQAVLPSRGIYEKPHILAAWLMWLSFLSVGIVSLLRLSVEQPYRAVATILYVPLLTMFAYVHYSRKKLYLFQMLMILTFDLAMMLIIVGTKK